MKMARRTKGHLSISELKVDPTPLVEIVNAGGNVSQVISKIIDLTGEGYDEIGSLLHVSGSHIGRIVRDETSTIKEVTLVDLTKEFNLPLEKMVYSNSIIKFNKVVGKDDSIKLHENLPSIKVAEDFGDYYVMDFVCLNYNKMRKAKTPQQRVKVIEGCATYSIVKLDYAPTQQKDNRLFIRHAGSHMMSPPQINQKSIPDRSIVEIEVIDEDEIKNGDIVYVQIGEELATCYIYQRQIHTSGGLIEQFRTVNPDYPLRTIAIPEGAKEGAETRRIIIGRAKSIIHYDLQI